MLFNYKVKSKAAVIFIVLSLTDNKGFITAKDCYPIGEPLNGATF